MSMDWQGRYYSGHGEGANRVGTTVSMVKGLPWTGRVGTTVYMDWQGRYYSVHGLAG